MTDTAYQLHIANKQRYKALKHSLKTIECFAIPSCDPETFEKFKDVESYLIKMYKPVKK